MLKKDFLVSYIYFKNKYLWSFFGIKDSKEETFNVIFKTMCNFIFCISKKEPYSVAN